MVIINNGATEFRDAIAAVLDEGQYGSDSTIESITDTGLGSPIADTKNTLEVTTSGNTIIAVHDTSVLEGNGEDLTEFALLNSSGDATTRVTTTAIDKDNTKEVTTTNIIYVDTN